jgi:RimJ/RimL family protein N-acetyltransferase
VIVRPIAHAEDLAGALDVHEAVAAEGKWIGAEAVDRDAVMSKWRASFLEGSSDVMFIAELDGAIVGSAALHALGRCGSGLYELGMSVAEESRGMGVGRALLESCISWARAAGGHKITLQVWPHNEPAQALYRKYGFVQEGYLKKHWRRRNGEIWDSVLMGLLLDPGGDNPRGGRDGA